MHQLSVVIHARRKSKIITGNDLPKRKKLWVKIRPQFGLKSQSTKEVNIKLMKNSRNGPGQILFTLAILPEQEQASSRLTTLQQLQLRGAGPYSHKGL